MTKTLFFLTALAAMVFALSAILIRWELSSAGVSDMFLTLDGGPDGARFGAATMTHKMSGFLTVLLLGSLMCAAAREKGARLAGLFTWLGCILSALLATALILALIPFSGSPEVIDPASGWILMPENGVLQPTYLSVLLDRFPQTMAQLGSAAAYDSGRMALIPAFSMLYLGAYAMLSTETGFGWIGFIGFLVLVVAAVLTVPNVREIDLPYGTVAMIPLALPFLACAAIRLIDGAPAWLVVLTLGLITSMIGQYALILQSGVEYSKGTMASAAILYTFPMGLAWFALPAVMLYRFDTRLPALAIWSIPVILAANLSLWLRPMFKVGFEGQALNYLDYPESFASDNLSISIAVVLFALVYLAVITLIARNRIRT